MELSRRARLVLVCFAAAVSSCFGGPTSDWPKGASAGDDGEGDGVETPAPSGFKDASFPVRSPLDAGQCVTKTPASDAGTEYEGDAGTPGPFDEPLPDEACL